MTKTNFNMKNFLTVLFASILVGTETVGIGLAFGWALGGFFELGKQGVLISELLFSSLGLVALWMFFKKARQIEPF
jgi:hypothetical protein